MYPQTMVQLTLGVDCAVVLGFRKRVPAVSNLNALLASMMAETDLHDDGSQSIR